MAENSLVIKKQDISDLEKITAKIMPWNKLGKRNPKSKIKLNPSKSFQNRVEYRGFTYIGEMTNLGFYTVAQTYLMGEVSLRKVAKHKIDEAIDDKVKWCVEIHPACIMEDGNPYSNISNSYMAKLISELELMGLKVPDKLLDSIFSPIEDTLVKIYKEIYNRYVEGVVDGVYYGYVRDLGFRNRPVTLLHVRDKHGIPYLLGFNEHVDVMRQGDSVEVEFNNERIAHLSRNVHIPNADKTVVETIKLEWYKIVSYKVKK